MLPWEDLKYVLALSRHGNATAAGRALGVNPTTVTRRVQALEEHLGSRLFNRHRDGALPTDAGQTAVRAALRVEEEVHGLDAEIRGLDQELAGPLRWTATDGFFDLWRSDLAEFQRQYPKLRLGLLSSDAIVDLTRREADVALRMTASPPEHLVGRRHAELFFAVYAAPSLVERVRSRVGRAPRYEAYPWIGWDEPFSAGTDRVIARHAPGAEVPLRINGMTQLTRSIEDGVGVSVLPCFVGDRCPDIVRLGPYLEGGLWLWTLTHEGLRQTARVRASLDLVARLAARDHGLLEGRAPREKAVPVG